MIRQSADFFEELEVVLSAKARAEAGEQLAAAVHTLQAAELAEANRRGEVKKAVEKLRTAVLDQAKAVHTGKVHRQVRCLEERDTSTGKARKVRTDTGEVLGERDLSATELEELRQGGLFGEEDKAAMIKELQAGLEAKGITDVEVKVS